MKFSQAPSSVLMIRPMAFGFNTQTASTNSFQHIKEEDPQQLQTRALQEFDRMVDTLRANDVDVIVVEDTLSPVKPDAVFPNNWISFHPTNTVILYPMMAENRRLERSIPVLQAIESTYKISEIIDLTHWEKKNKFLEGTGSVVFDHQHKIAYACRSPRTHEDVLKDLCQKVGYHYILIDAVDEHNQPIYHTNVLLCIATHIIIICLDVIKGEEDQEILLSAFAATGRTVVAVSLEQLSLFAANMMEVISQTGEPLMLLSEKAFASLLPGQLDAISKYAEPIPVSIPTIEQVGGGSVRCMVAGIFNKPL